MLDFLYAFPNTVISLLFGTVMLLAVVILPSFVGPFLRVERDKDTADFAVRGQATVISFLAIILGFSLVGAQGNLRTIESHVAAEASAINQMDRLLQRYGDPQVAEMRKLLVAYTESIVTVEWPQMVQGGDVTVGSKPPLGQLSRAVYTIEPSAGRQTEIYNQILKQIDQLTEARSQRIEDSTLRLPGTFWQIIFSLFVILVALALLIEPTVGRSIAIGAQVLAVTLLLSLVFIYDVPFKGQTTVLSTEIVKTLALIKNRTS